jgi:4-hydroxybenzoate polyprenyltransferase
MKRKPQPPPLKDRIIALSLVALMFFAGWMGYHATTDLSKGSWVAVLVLSLLTVLGMMFKDFEKYQDDDEDGFR